MTPTPNEQINNLGSRDSNRKERKGREKIGFLHSISEGKCSREGRNGRTWSSQLDQGKGRKRIVRERSQENLWDFSFKEIENLWIWNSSKLKRWQGT
uniref:Si946063f09 n=1 Tax=Arundo donax TaxID=35708 RepID=A0A0A9EF26_ARUDO